MVKQAMCAVSIGVVMFNSISEPLVVLANVVTSKEIMKEVSIDEWIDENGNAHFPVMNEDEVWEQLTIQSKREVCQIPENILNELSTEQLLDLVEQYPLFSMLCEYDDEEIGFQTLCSTFNGLEELMSRDDCMKVVLNEYMQWKIPEETLFDYGAYIREEKKVEDMNMLSKDKEAMKLIRQDAREKYMVSIMEMILAQDVVQEKISEEDAKTLAVAIMDKNEMKKASACFKYTVSNSYSNIVGTDNKVMIYIRQAELLEKKDSIIMGQSDSEWDAIMPLAITITTRSKTAVSITVGTLSRVMTEAEALEWISEAPGAFIVEIPTTDYNCAAYAWLWLDSWNRSYRKTVNVVSIKPFTSDSAYQKYSTPTVNGSVVHWSAHEGIIEDLNYKFTMSQRVVTEPLVVTKLGSSGPLVGMPLSTANDDWGRSPTYYK